MRRCAFLAFSKPPITSSTVFVVNVGKKHFGGSAAAPAWSWQMQFVQLQNCRIKCAECDNLSDGCCVLNRFAHSHSDTPSDSVRVTWLEQMEGGNYRWMLRHWKLLYCSTVSNRDVLLVRFWSDHCKKQRKRKKKKEPGITFLPVPLPQLCGKSTKTWTCWWDVTRLGGKK